MVKVIGVRFRNAGKIYYFDPLDMDIEVGQNVIVETARGIEYGHVLIAPREVDNSNVIQPLKAVIRLATPEDDEIEQKNKEKEKDAFKICLEKIAKHKLQMKLIDAEYTFDNNKVFFILRQTGVLISVSWSKIWHLFLKHVLNCVRSVSVMRQRLWAVLVFAAEVSAVILSCLNLHRYLLRWQRSRICR